MKTPFAEFDAFEGLPTVELAKELALEAELMAPDGIVPEEMNRHLVDITNRRMIEVDEQRRIAVLAYASLRVPGLDETDLEFMADAHVAEAYTEGRFVAFGYNNGFQHLSSVAFTGLGIRLNGVTFVEPFEERADSILVPVQAVGVAVPRV